MSIKNNMQNVSKVSGSNEERRNSERLQEIDALFELLRKKRQSLALSHKMYRSWLAELKGTQKNLTILLNMAIDKRQSCGIIVVEGTKPSAKKLVAKQGDDTNGS